MITNTTFFIIEIKTTVAVILLQNSLETVLLFRNACCILAPYEFPKCTIGLEN